MATSAVVSTSGNPSSLLSVPSATFITSTSTYTSTPAPAHSSTNAGAIAGGVVGALLGVAIIMAILFFLVRRERMKVSTSTFTTAPPPMLPPGPQMQQPVQPSPTGFAESGQQVGGHYKPSELNAPSGTYGSGSLAPIYSLTSPPLSSGMKTGHDIYEVEAQKAGN
ncbi:MAG: hypothetical protein M1813_000392 [Trichoglossum hirsutum]|nr:MAG: hypothetical protein M1813_000392 [Trichoglossum hirsutum]